MGIRMPLRAGWPAVVAVVAALAAYWWWGPLPGDGRVRAGLGGTTALGAPAQNVWTATVGGVLCTDGRPVAVEDVDVETSGDVRNVSFQVLTMQPEQVRAAGAGGYGAARGTPPDFDEPYAEGDPLPGRYEDAVGAVVTEPCDPGRADGPTEQQSLLAVVTVGPRGGGISDLRVTYRSWGRDRSAGGDIGSVVVCGVDQTSRGCPGMRQ